METASFVKVNSLFLTFGNGERSTFTEMFVLQLALDNLMLSSVDLIVKCRFSSACAASLVVTFHALGFKWF